MESLQSATGLLWLLAVTYFYCLNSARIVVAGEWLIFDWAFLHRSIRATKQNGIPPGMRLFRSRFDRCSFLLCLLWKGLIAGQSQPAYLQILFEFWEAELSIAVEVGFSNQAIDFITMEAGSQDVPPC